jgi:hypothetical protein
VEATFCGNSFPAALKLRSDLHRTVSVSRIKCYRASTAHRDAGPGVTAKMAETDKSERRRVFRVRAGMVAA